ncbi:hypothetical protein AGMMS49957_16250 [Synergistales bacterium]|nr:hypothetical protein AGMMS49957_16250 [Synergistales bacterium]
MNSLFAGIDLTDDITNAKIEKLRAERAKTEKQIADAKRQIEQMENKIKRLAGGLSKQERNARTSRLIGRGAIAEKFIDNAAALTNDEFKDALSQAVRVTR